jgi:hypothetical protein
MAQKTKSVLAKYGDRVRKAVTPHKDDETKIGAGGDLPPGIDGGVAQLVDIKFGLFQKGDNEGEAYFMAQGVVVSPDDYKGMRTKIGPEAMCDTPSKTRKTTDDHVSWVMNEMRKLGLKTAEYDDGDLEEMAAILKEAKPYFRFRTWRPDPTPEFPSPRTFEDWRGVCEWQDDGSDPVEDKSPEAPEEQETETATASWEADDLEAMGEAASAGDTDAMAELSRRAKAAGLNPDDIETWEETAELVGKAEASNGEEAETDDAPLPEKGEVYNYQPPKSKKTVEVEIVAVNAEKRTVSAKSLDDGTVYKGVSFDELKG